MDDCIISFGGCLFPRVGHHKNIEKNKINLEGIKMKVIFRKDKDGEIIAFFPEDFCMGEFPIYSHRLQFAYATLDYYNETGKATEEEYQDLFNELTNIGGYDDLTVEEKMEF